MFGMIGMRRERAIYVSIWYYMSSFMAIAMLFIFNNMEVPTFLWSGDAPSSIMHSISMYSGTNDAFSCSGWYGA